MKPAPPPPAPRQLPTWAPLALLALAAALAFANALPNPFIMDDAFIILRDQRVQKADLPALLTGGYWPPPRVNGGGLWRPLLSFSLGAQWALTQTPWAFRLVNLALHVAAALVLFALAQDLARSRWVALGAAALFVVHPIHTTTSNQIVSRADILAGLGALLAVWLAHRNRAGPGWARTLAIAACFAAALAGKESAVVAIGIIVWLDLCYGRRFGPDHPRPGPPRRWLSARLLRLYLPLLLVLVAYLVGRRAVIGSLVLDLNTLSQLDNVIAHPEWGLRPGESVFLARWGTPLAVFGQAMNLLVWPRTLSCDYSYAAIDSVRTLADHRLWVGLGWLTACGVALLVSWRRGSRVTCAALGMMLIAYSIVSNSLVVIGAIFAERFMYLPAAGFCLFAAQAAAHVARRLVPASAGPRRWPANVVPVAFALLVASALTRSAIRNRDFADDDRLYQTDLRAQPRSARLWRAVAQNAFEAGDYAGALERAQRSHAILEVQPLTWNLIGLSYWRLGAGERAVPWLRRAFDSGLADVELAALALSDLLRQEGRPAEACDILRAYVNRNPGSAAAHNNLAWYLATSDAPELHDPEQALRHARRAVELSPGRSDFVDTCAEVLTRLGRKEELRALLVETLAGIGPDDPERPALERRLRDVAP
jgi:tetratricopeptide (TPR) repeat protein